MRKRSNHTIGSLYMLLCVPNAPHPGASLLRQPQSGAGGRVGVGLAPHLVTGPPAFTKPSGGGFFLYLLLVDGSGGERGAQPAHGEDIAHVVEGTEHGQGVPEELADAEAEVPADEQDGAGERHRRADEERVGEALAEEELP